MALNVSPQLVRGGKSPWATIIRALQESEGEREKEGRREGMENVEEGDSGERYEEVEEEERAITQDSRKFVNSDVSSTTVANEYDWLGTQVCKITSGLIVGHQLQFNLS